MFGIGGLELLVIAVVLIIAVGPDKMPVFLKTVVKGIRDFRRTTQQLRNSVGIDQLLNEDLNVNHVAAQPRLVTLSDYERTRENPLQGPDMEYAYQLRVDMDEVHRAEYPMEGPDVAHAQREIDESSAGVGAQP